jgi:nucleoside-diphosphate-sugar epimerase
MTRLITKANVAVVGGAGFLGSHLVNHLVEEKGCNVIVIDNLVVGQRGFIHPNARFVHHDITGSEEFLWKLFQKSKVQFVFNYAAWPYIPESFVRPLHVFDVNAMGAIKVINAAHAAKCEAILQISSAELYGNCIDKISESGKVIPHSTYGAAKAAVDYYCQSAWRERETPVIALRQFNCVGERETHPYIVPEIISQIYHSKEKVIRLGNNSSRDFLYAGDAVCMATELLEKGQFGEVYNLGSEQTIKIYDLAIKISNICFSPSLCKVEPDESRMRPWEIWYLQSDNTKIYTIIKSRPQVSLEEGLNRTINYYIANNSRWCWE